jgi:hypothetical protein
MLFSKAVENDFLVIVTDSQDDQQMSRGKGHAAMQAQRMQ